MTLLNEIFSNPWLLLLLMVIPALVTWYVLSWKKQYSGMIFPRVPGEGKIPASPRQKWMHLPFILKMFALAFIIVAIARPQTSVSQQDVSVVGIDIVICMDISSSMLAEDFKPHRLEAAKEVAIDFISGRPNDRIGLVAFSGEAFSQCPLTTDHAVLKGLFEPLKPGMIEDGTAIGDGLGTSVNRLKSSHAISKVIILLTDGVNNRGSMPPATAAEIAKELGIRIYTIGVGSEGMARTPVGMYPDGRYAYDYVKVEIDESALKDVAITSGGRYFRATNKGKLKEIYNEIDKLEKSKIDVTEFRKKNENFHIFLIIGIILFVLDFLLAKTVFRVQS